MTVLCLSYYFPPVNAAPSFRALKLTNGLHGVGIHSVILTKNIDKEFHIHRTTDLTLLKDIDKRSKVLRARYFSPTVFHLPFKLLGIITRFVRGKKKIASRTELKARGGLPRDPLVPDHYIEWLPQAFHKVNWYKNKSAIDIIYASGPPFSMLVLGYLLKALLKKPLVVEYRDVLTDDPYNKAPEFKEKINRFIEHVILKDSDAVISVSSPINDGLIKKYGLESSRKKFFEIPSAFDPADFEKVADIAQVEGKFTITITTTLYGARKPDNLFKVLGKLKKDGVLAGIDFEVNIYGYNDYERFKSQLQELGIDDIVHFKGFIPHDACLAVLKQSTFNLDLAEEDFDYPTLPYHLWEYIGSGKKILHFGVPGHYKANYVTQNDLGYVLPANHPKQVYTILADLINEFKTGSLSTALSSTVAAQQTWNPRVQALTKVFRSIQKSTRKK
ncbi:MAG TPA: glycosyltransferase [Candidatus Lokiarchaeia archaeon]|nr:glycosyltransferase [Candidatus Lokiarchaeia archaeon]